MRAAMALAMLALATIAAPVSAQEIEARSFTGAALTRPVLSAAAQAEQERLLGEAQAALVVNPGDADAAIWIGRRLGYLGRYRDAIAAFEAGAIRHPNDARFPRHLGHRLISVRRIDDAIAALTRAEALMADGPDEVEPDGLPNAAGVPTSTLKGNIAYHLGLAHYLNGDFDAAARTFAGAVALSANADSAVASRYWLYLSLARTGQISAARVALAPISADWTIIENEPYFRLTLCFRGEGDCAALLNAAQAHDGVRSSTLAYGLAAQALIEGRRRQARALMTEIVAAPDWASFGYIAAEADLAPRLR
jgi:tetratricopeptide (TPR) repeat protein